jgi:hypothetical protein
MNTLKLRNGLIILPVIVSIVYIALAIFLTLNMWPKNDLEKDTSLGVIRGTVLFVDSLCILSVWGFISILRRNLRYRIIFGEGYVEENRNLRPFSKRVKIAYDQIKRVSYEWPGVLAISSFDGAKLKVPLNSMEGGKQKILDLVKIHLPHEVVKDNLSEKIENVKPFEKRHLYVGYVIVAFYFLALFGRDLLSLFPISWNIYGNWGARDVAGYQIESQDSIWVVTTNLGGSAEVIHYGENVSRWQLPDPKTSIDYHDAIVLSDSQGQPTVINREGEIYVWSSNGEWTQTKFSEGHAPWIFGDYYTSSRTDAWFILHRENADTVLAQVHAGSNKIDLMELPEYAKEKEYEPYRLSILPDDTVLVLAGKHESAVFVLKNGEWQEAVYPANSHPSMIIRDFTVDANGRLYFLHAGFHEDKNMVEMVDAGKTVETELPGLDDDFRYEHLEVDKNGRLWIDGGYESKVIVLKPVWGGTAEEIVSYSESNSSFSGDSDEGLRLLSNGQIWSADRKLVWIDSNLERLPQPLPVWVGIVNGRSYQFIIYLSFMLFLFLWNFYMKSISKKYYNN